MAFESLTDKLQNVFKNLRSKGRLTEEDVKSALKEVKMALLEADVNFKVVKQFVKAVEERAIGQDVMNGLNPGQMVIKIVNEEMVNLMGSETTEIAMQPGKAITVIMMAGLQGAGKNTATAKIAGKLKLKGKKPLLVACDIYRPAAIEQLQINGKKQEVDVFSMGTDHKPAEIAQNAIAYAEKNGHNVVILDTAGRLHVDEDMMAELQEIKETVTVHQTLLVVDAMTGQDAVNAATAFDQALGIDGVMLTKLDGDARGGAALSIRAATGKPIKFVGTGEKLDMIELFHPDRMASRILDMGDIMTLIEQAQKQFDEEEARKAAEKISEGSFGLDDFLDQLQQVRKLGSMKSLLGMIPGMAQHRKELEQFDEKEIDRTEAIIRSMTPAERRDPSIINGSRRARIAYGSGVTVSQVNALLQRFEQAAKMMKRMSNRGGMGGGIPGFGGPAMGGGKKKGKNKKKGGKSGNPMKREAEEKALRDKLAGKSSGSTGGSAFAKKSQNPALPAGLEQMMGNVDGGTELPPNLGGGLGGLFGR